MYFSHLARAIKRLKLAEKRLQCYFYVVVDFSNTSMPCFGVFCNTLERVCFAQLLSMYDLVPALLCWLIHEGLLEPRWGLWQSWARCTATKRGGDKCIGWHQTLMCNVTSWIAHRCILYISLSLGFGNMGSQSPTRWKIPTSKWQYKDHQVGQLTTSWNAS